MIVLLEVSSNDVASGVVANGVCVGMRLRYGAKYSPSNFDAPLRMSFGVILGILRSFRDTGSCLHTAAPMRLRVEYRMMILSGALQASWAHYDVLLPIGPEKYVNMTMHMHIYIVRVLCVSLKLATCSRTLGLCESSAVQLRLGFCYRTRPNMDAFEAAMFYT